MRLRRRMRDRRIPSKDERLMRERTGAGAICDGERHGRHRERNVAAREDAAHRRLLRSVRLVKGAERAGLELAAERFGERVRDAVASEEKKPVELTTTTVAR